MSSTWNGTGRNDTVPMYLVQKYKSILQRHFETEFIHLWKLQPWREDDGQPKRRNQVFEEPPPPCFFTPALSYFSLVFVMEHNWQLKYPNNRSHHLSRPINYPPNPPILAELTFALLHFSLRIFDHQRSTLTEDFHSCDAQLSETQGPEWAGRSRNFK